MTRGRTINVERRKKELQGGTIILTVVLYANESRTWNKSQGSRIQAMKNKLKQITCDMSVVWAEWTVTTMEVYMEGLTCLVGKGMNPRVVQMAKCSTWKWFSYQETIWHWSYIIHEVDYVCASERDSVDRLCKVEKAAFKNTWERDWEDWSV